jgi:hypothetical protein
MPLKTADRLLYIRIAQLLRHFGDPLFKGF